MLPSVAIVGVQTSKLKNIFYLYLFTASAEKPREGIYRNTGDIAPNETCRLQKKGQN